MNTIRTMRLLMAGLGVIFLLNACYKEEHFDFPGPFELDQRVPDTLPFPFDSTRQAGIWLMKDGVPDHAKILFKGYTDYYPAGDTLSWRVLEEGYKMIPHRNYYPINNGDHFGDNPNSYQFNWVYSKYFVPVGAGKSFYMYARVTVGTFSGTAAGIVLGQSWDTGTNFVFGMDGAGNVAPTFFVNLYGTTIGVSPSDGWPTVNEVLVPGVPAEVEVVIHEGLFYCKINGTLCLSFRLPQEQQIYYFTPQIRPHRNYITMHDMYIESSDMYTVNYAMHEQEQGYARIQSPSLAETDGGLLLFAEGRSNPRSAEERVAQNTMSAGDVDILMRRSTDGGQSWEDNISVLAGSGTGETFCFPRVIRTASGKLILHYNSLPGEVIDGTYQYDPAGQRVFQITSEDGGASWSAPVDISEGLLDGNALMEKSAAHGIELQGAAHKGRLVVPLSFGGNRIRVAISDDGGASWRLGSQLPGNRLRYGTLVELPDSRLMMVSGHANTTPRTRFRSYSEDGGETWSQPEQLGATVATGDFGHLYPGALAQGDNGELYLVNPLNRKSDSQTYSGPVFPTSPHVFSSNDGGLSFSAGQPLFERIAYRNYLDPAGFMDAEVLDDGTLVVVTEGGVERPQEGIVVYRK